MLGDAAVDAFVCQVLNAYPRLDLQRALPESLVALYRRNPAATASQAVADAWERLVPGFRRFNLCDVLLAHAGQSSAAELEQRRLQDSLLRQA